VKRWQGVYEHFLCILAPAGVGIRIVILYPFSDSVLMILFTIAHFYNIMTLCHLCDCDRGVFFPTRYCHFNDSDFVLLVCGQRFSVRIVYNKIGLIIERFWPLSIVKTTLASSKISRVILRARWRVRLIPRVDIYSTAFEAALRPSGAHVPAEPAVKSVLKSRLAIS